MINKQSYPKEYVMVFPTTLLKTTGYFQGLSFEVRKYKNTILDSKNYLFMERDSIETNQDFKQIIPYLILKYKKSILIYERGKLLSEKRLLGNYSIGIGGHISINDPSLFGIAYDEGLNRELREEIDIQSEYKIKLKAVLNDDKEPVGKVHFGFIHIVVLSKPIVKSKEKSINKLQFQTIPEIRKNIDLFENWSKICINKIDRLLA